MKIRKWFFVFLLAAGLSCNFITRAIYPATPTPIPTPTQVATLTATLEPSQTPEPTATGQAVYVPQECQGQPIATVPAATEQALPTPGIVPNNPLTTPQQLDLFDKVVAQINAVYLYPDFNGVDWKGITATYRDKVKAGLETEAFYSLMSSLIGELKDNHSQFFSPSAVAAVNTLATGKNDYVGIGALVGEESDKSRGTILAVFDGSPAEHAGLQPHDSILAIDGQPIYENGKYYLTRTRGPQCSAVNVTIQSPGEQPRVVTMVRFRINSPVPLEAHLVKTSDGSRIGYIFLYSFLDQTLPDRVAQALRDFGPLDGLILDNRENGGGSSDVVMPILSHFTDGKLGNFLSHGSSRPFVVSADPIANSQKVPLVILISKNTASFGEIFTGILQDIGRAKVVGQTSAGIVELLHVFQFTDGSNIWIAAERFDPKVSHVNWEKKGITPDVTAFADWDSYSVDTDPGLLAALKLLGHQ